MSNIFCKILYILTFLLNIILYISIYNIFKIFLMVNTITDNENINKGWIIKEVLDERIENFEKISKIISISEVQKEIWELQRLKRTLKYNKENFKIFEEKLKTLYDKSIDISEKELQELFKLDYFCRFYKKVKSQIRKIKTEIRKNKNTKREILIIWQIHFTKNWKWNVFAEMSQKYIDIFLEYFLDDNLVIWNELSWTKNIFDFRKNIENNLQNYLKNKWYIEFENDNIIVSWKENVRKIDKYFENLEMITFFGKQYFKKDDENFFKKLCIYKFYINTFKDKTPWILSEINYENFKFMNLWKKEFINIEAEENPIYLDLYNFLKYNKENILLQEEIKKDLEENFFSNWVEYFFENNLENLFEKYFVDENILLSEFKDLIKKNNDFLEKEEYPSEIKKIIYKKLEKIQNEFFKNQYDFYFSDLLKISKNKYLDFKSKIQKLIFNLEFKLESFKKDF